MSFFAVPVSFLAIHLERICVMLLANLAAQPPAGMHSAATFKGPPKTFLNDVAFVQNHVFGSDTRILTGKNQAPQ